MSGYDARRFGLANPAEGDCLFCNIATKRIDALVIAESDKAIAFMNIAPVAPGHSLVIPKQHSPNMLFAQAEDLAATAMLTQAVTQALIKAVDCPGVSLWQANGVAGGQTVAHTHVHVVPRWPNDNVKVLPHAEPQPPGDLEPLASQIRSFVR